MGVLEYYTRFQSTFTNVTRERLCFLLSLCAVFSIVFDMIASYQYYILYPETFVKFEATREAVHFFVDGAIPPMFFISMFTYPIVIYLAIWWFDQGQQKWQHNRLMHTLIIDGRWLFVFGIVATCFARIAAGLTWYDGDTYIMNVVTHVLQGTIIFTLGASMCIIVIILWKNTVIKRLQKPMKQEICQ